MNGDSQNVSWIREGGGGGKMTKTKLVRSPFT